MKKAAILAAGEGQRLKALCPFKPIVKVNGKALLELTIENLQFNNFDRIVLIFNEDEKAMDLSLLPSLKKLSIEYFFKTTKSSMHSLYEVQKRLDLKPDEHFFCTMVDSIVPQKSIEAFHLFCQTIAPHESAIMVTPYIEDEKPLTVAIDGHNYVTEFQCPITEGTLITSGIYYLSAQSMPLLESLIANGQDKMRNFLTQLVKNNHPIKVFIVDKTLDIDRPEDIASVEAFLKEQI